MTVDRQVLTLFSSLPSGVGHLTDSQDSLRRVILDIKSGKADHLL
ncbi:hypothetical protein ACVW19_004275 [Streptomyces sp. TE5632]